MQACLDFYENLYIQFHTKYTIVKGMLKMQDEEKKRIFVDALAGRWKESLNFMLYGSKRCCIFSTVSFSLAYMPN